MTWTHLPPGARAIAVTASDAVAAAQARDHDGFSAAIGRLAAAEGAGLVLGTAVRLLLEERHPDGLDGEDVRGVLQDCVRSAAQWQPGVDPHVVLLLLAGALGVHGHDDDAPQPDAAVTASHAALLSATLLTGARWPLARYLTAAFAEIARTERYD